MITDLKTEHFTSDLKGQPAHVLHVNVTLNTSRYAITLRLQNGMTWQELVRELMNFITQVIQESKP